MDEFRTLRRVIIVGALSNAIGFLAYLGATSAGLSPKLAMTILYIVGTCVGFFGNRRWSFAHEGSLSLSAVLYIIVYAIGYGIDWTMLHYFVDTLHYPHPYVQAAAMAVIAVFLFLSMRFFVFPRRAN